ncbi:hypothetical protein SETIT_3G398600v2 [Setaria italica]|uniref:Uncharacterized protein n=1 Tax=Setaria italica TaxID=4555 RepID=K3Z7E6_SETIT|nr:uncharacterized protein LOC101761204 [Setaria italica]RCV19597.1 hypothetical protein SETIT_3G398600v2 [Setaria italica]
MPTTTSPLKRPSAGGRLRRLLASLRPPARAGPLPVQTGFPTSLADLVVKNHGRLKKPRRRHRAIPAPPPVAASAAELAPQQRRDLSAAQQDGAVPAPPPSRPKGAGFTVRPELLAVGGVMALALLVIWSKRLVAAATLASVALFWIESFRSPASRRRPRPETTEEELDSQGRGLVSPIREAESPAETPRPSCAAAPDTGSEFSSLWAADTTDELACDDPGSISPSKRKEKRRSLRKLLAKKLQNGKRGKDGMDSRHGGESGHPVAGEVSAPEPAVAAAPAEETVAPAPEAVTDDGRHRRQGGGALPLAAFVPVILAGLVAGKLPAVALTVLCAVFFTSVERAPDVSVAQASGHGSDPR